MRSSNVPVPEAHVAAVVAGIGLDWLIPLRVPVGRRRWRLAIPLLAAGAVLGVWAVASAGEIDVESDEELVTGGAYGLTRNPMYLGWSLVVLGVAVAHRSVWLAVGWARAVRQLDGEIRVEERRLDARFGDRAAAYRARVPRYLRLPWA